MDAAGAVIGVVTAGTNGAVSESVEVVGDGAPGDSEAEIALSGAEVVLVSDNPLPEYPDFAATCGETRALVLLSEDDGAALRLSSLSLAGWGVVPPDAPPEEISAAIAAVANGLVVLLRAFSKHLLESHPSFEGLEDAPEPLTARESEVLDLLSRGLANKSIARELSVSEHTVKFHVSSIYSKLQVQTRAEAVSCGARLGLLRL